MQENEGNQKENGVWAWGGGHCSQQNWWIKPGESQIGSNTLWSRSISKGPRPALGVEQRMQEVRSSCSTHKSRDCSKFRTKPTKSLFSAVLAHPAPLCSFTSLKSLAPVPVPVLVPIPVPVSRSSTSPGRQESDPRPRTCPHPGAGPYPGAILLVQDWSRSRSPSPGE